jgi:hypothetical protein
MSQVGLKLSVVLNEAGWLAPERLKSLYVAHIVIRSA